MKPSTPQSAELPDTAPARGAHIVADYSRQLRVQGMSDEKQAALAQARVLVVGAGGLGVTALSYLAAAGVGAITIVDHDTIEASNLHRQTIYRYADIGAYKAHAAVDYLRERTVDCTLTAITEHATLDNVLPLMQGEKAHHVILDCTDDMAVSYMLNDVAWHTQSAVVFANASAMQGQLFVLDARAEHTENAHATTACLRCLWPEKPTDATDNNDSTTTAATCDVLGVLGPVPGILGCLQAMEAIKLITGFQSALHNHLLHYSFDQHRQHRIRVAPQSSCRHQIDSNALHARHDFDARQRYTGSLADAVAQGYTVVDVRSTAESQNAPLAESALCVPVDTLLENPETHLDTCTRYVLACSSGIRSKRAARALRGRYDKLWFYP